MATISRNLEQLGPNFALHSLTTQDLGLQNIIGISTKMRALGLGQRYDKQILDPTVPVAALNQSNTYWS